ncbi:MAG: hypothetical protein Q8R76_07340 [Candidatus Omnitrophota bacterium]|nr:hypothetical protein [Candidatus Omnitrophota bacterium]
MNLRGNEKKAMIGKLLVDMEEEDVAISLFDIFMKNTDELEYFPEEERSRVVKILKRLSDDSKRHKEMLWEIIDRLGKGHP